MANPEYSAEQWDTLVAIADTIIPSINISDSRGSLSQLTLSTKSALALEQAVRRIRPDYPSTAIVQEYFAEKASSVSLNLLKRVLYEYLPLDAKNKIGALLGILRYKISSVILDGSSYS